MTAEGFVIAEFAGAVDVSVVGEGRVRDMARDLTGCSVARQLRAGCENDATEHCDEEWGHIAPLSLHQALTHRRAVWDWVQHAWAGMRPRTRVGNPVCITLYRALGKADSGLGVEDKETKNRVMAATCILCR